MSRTAVAIRHILFEDLGVFETVLRQAGYAVGYVDAGVDNLARIDPVGMDILIILGGPIGACDDHLYPFLEQEVRLIHGRLPANLPVLGLCLGAQLIARALGAEVSSMPAKEIGFKPLALTEEARNGLLSVFDGQPVLHWHGDTFDLPDGATLLASTDMCPHQAFSFGNALALQFHPEAHGPNFELWLVGHTVELHAAGIDIRALRAANIELSFGLAARATRFFEIWLESFDAVQTIA